MVHKNLLINLQSFLKNAEQVSKGNVGANSSAGVVDNANKISEDNVGFQLLRKSGWTEGSGLGLDSSGIVNPISIHSTGAKGGGSSNSGGAVMSASAINRLVGANSGTSGGGGVGGSGGPEGSGIGVKATHEVSADYNEFDQYRKRMMLAYRFRPNPMNNPRRDYY